MQRGIALNRKQLKISYTLTGPSPIHRAAHRCGMHGQLPLMLAAAWDHCKDL